MSILVLFALYEIKDTGDIGCLFTAYTTSVYTHTQYYDPKENNS